MIDESIEREVLQRMESLRDNRWERISSEIQDGGCFLLLIVHLHESQVRTENIQEIRRLLSEVCRELIPQRSGEYAWMINIQGGQGLLDSVSGGWIEFSADVPSEK